MRRPLPPSEPQLRQHFGCGNCHGGKCQFYSVCSPFNQTRHRPCKRVIVMIRADAHGIDRARPVCAGYDLLLKNRDIVFDCASRQSHDFGFFEPAAGSDSADYAFDPQIFRLQPGQFQSAREHPPAARS